MQNNNDNRLILALPQRFILAVIGDAGAGKTTTITKTFDKLTNSGRISSTIIIDGQPDILYPTQDFILTCNTIYGKMGIASRGDQTCYMLDDFKRMAQLNVNVILCACRKFMPKTFAAVAETSWKYGYTILWIDCTCPNTLSKDVYTDNLSDMIVDLF